MAIIHTYGTWSIEKAEGNWLPENLIYHSREFVDWIESFTFNGFQNRIQYELYENYKWQAYKWLSQNINPLDCKTEHEREEIEQREIARVDANTLYFNCKYGKYSDGNSTAGIANFRAKEHCAIVDYLLDCRYSILAGKPRHIFFSTLIGLYGVKKLITQFNFRMNYINADDKKGMDLLRDMFKFPFGELPYWMKPAIANNSLKVFHIGKTGKEVVGRPNSRIEQLAPTATAINSGSPQVTLLDEVADQPEVTATIFETRPTMFADSSQDGKLDLVKQIVAWSTGVTGNKGKKNFERLYSSTVKMWEAKAYRSCLFIPIFFDWTCRCSREHYEAEKLAYLAGTSDIQELSGMSEKQREEVFHMHYPTSYRDMWGTSSNMLVDREVIMEGREKIRKLPEMLKPVYGKFEPIYDQNVAEKDNSDVPYKIIGARWVAADDMDDKDEVTTCMIMPPDRDWRNRYFQGTDPIAADTGSSFMSSCIWDRAAQTKNGQTEAPVCYIYHRKPHDQEATFLQCLLMGLYYDTNSPSNQKEGVKELIENNIGALYIKYLQDKDFGKRIVMNMELSEMDLRGGGSLYGINTSGHGNNRRKKIVVGKLGEVIKYFGQNIYFDIFWKECETYVNLGKDGESWKPVDKNYRDDCLDSTAFAKICSDSFAFLPLKKVEKEEIHRKVIRKKLVRNKQGNLELEVIR